MRLLHANAPVLEERAGRACELGVRLAVVDQRGDLGELCLREVVLPREDEEVGAQAGLEAILLGAQLRPGAARPARAA